MRQTIDISWSESTRFKLLFVVMIYKQAVGTSWSNAPSYTVVCSNYMSNSHTVVTSSPGATHPTLLNHVYKKNDSSLKRVHRRWWLRYRGLKTNSSSLARGALIFFFYVAWSFILGRIICWLQHRRRDDLSASWHMDGTQVRTRGPWLFYCIVGTVDVQYHSPAAIQTSSSGCLFFQLTSMIN
jgi:hypothetical protein